MSPEIAALVARLETRIAEHKAAQQRFVANIQALDGAIQEAQFHLDALRKLDASTAPEPPVAMAMPVEPPTGWPS